MYNEKTAVEPIIPIYPGRTSRGMLFEVYRWSEGVDELAS